MKSSPEVCPQIPIYETRLVRKGRLKSPPSITNSFDLFDLVKSRFKDLDREHFGVLYLDSGLRPIGFKIESIGVTGQCMVDTRLLIKDALVANASSIALVHNHPSGQGSPSAEDRQLTNAISKACSFIGIRLLDHLIIHNQGFFSFLEAGELRKET